MAKKTYCDLCDKEVPTSVSIEFRDGEHPHNGSTMHRDADVCLSCLKKVKHLSTNMEFDNVKLLCS